MTVESVKVQKVIRLETVVGKGTKESPIKKVVQFWTTNGVMIGEKEINELQEYQR